MRFPQEVVVQRFLPTYRCLLAEALDQRDLAQRTIADLIGVTQAQVSKYLAGQLTLEPRLTEDPRVRSTVEEVADGLTSGRLDTVGALARSLALVARLQAGGPLADLHQEAMPKLAGTGFDATLAPDSLAMREHQVLTEMRQALDRLVAVPGLAGWIPHVGSNLAQARADATEPWDVAALPGRLDAVGGRPRAATEPTFGGSHHVATIVLAVMDVEPNLRAALNLAYRPRLLELAEAAGLDSLAFEADYEGRRDHVRERLQTHVEGAGQVPAVLYHEGAFGIEPVAYLVAEDSLALVELVRELLAPEAHHT